LNGFFDFKILHFFAKKMKKFIVTTPQKGSPQGNPVIPTNKNSKIFHKKIHQARLNGFFCGKSSVLKKLRRIFVE
jgi:hypothetical protein